VDFPFGIQAEALDEALPWLVTLRTLMEDEVTMLDPTVK
jgi:hypothetical protein